MNDESGHEAGSKDSPFTLDRSLSNSAIKPKKKKPCEICGSVADELLIMTCFSCRETREHTYCARVKFQRVPCMWLCEECRNYSSKPEIADKTANSRTNQVEEAVVDIEAAPSSKANQVEHVMEGNKAASIDQATTLTRTNQSVDNEETIDQTAPSSRNDQVVNNKASIEIAPSSRNDQVVNNKASIEIAPSSRTNQVEQVVPVVPHILDQYTTDESPLESSCPVSPRSLVFKPQWENFIVNRSEYIDLSSDSGSEE